LPDETAFVEPKTEEITVRARLLGGFEGIARRLSGVETLEIEKGDSLLRVVRVESRDIQKRPFLFVMMELGADRLTVSYTVAADSSPKLRRMVALKEALSVLSLITDLYSVDNAELFQCLDSAVDELSASLSQSYSSLFNSYDAIFNEYKELRKINVELTAANKNLSVQASQLSEENKAFAARVKELEGYSDDSLMVMAEEWLEAHNSEIDVGEFSRVYKLSPTRVEGILNKMVSLGYIELKG
jgi:hypothetical protein